MGESWNIGKDARKKYRKTLREKGITEENVNKYSSIPKEIIGSILEDKKISIDWNDYQKLNRLLKRDLKHNSFKEIDDEFLKKLEKLVSVFENKTVLAKEIGITSTTIANILNRKCKSVNIRTYKAILKYYEQVSISYKVSENKEEEKTEKSVEELNAEERQEIINENKKNYKKLEVNKTYDIKIDREDEIKHVKILEEFKGYYLGQLKKYRITILKNDLYKDQVKIKEIN